MLPPARLVGGEVEVVHDVAGNEELHGVESPFGHTSRRAAVIVLLTSVTGSGDELTVTEPSSTLPSSQNVRS